MRLRDGDLGHASRITTGGEGCSTMRVRVACVAALTVFSLRPGCVAQAQQQAKACVATQFADDEPFRCPKPIPPDVLSQLKADILKSDDCEAEIRSFSAKWFVASSISLRATSANDLIVKAVKECANGATTASFWVFAADAKRHRLLLSTGALSIRTLKTSSKGFADLEQSAATTSKAYYVRFRYDGNRYLEHRSWTEKLPSD
jgi:hypothetical protein